MPAVVPENTRELLTPDVLEELRLLQARSGTGATGMLRWAAQNGHAAPDGLSHIVISGWFTGKTKTADPDHLAFASRMWGLISTERERVALTPEDMERLKAYREARLLPARLFEDARDVPEGLRVPIVRSWLSGSVREVRRDHLAWVLDRCSELADARPRTAAITAEIRAELNALRERVGVGVERLLRMADDKPDDLRIAEVFRWLNGAADTARADHLDYILQSWRALPAVRFVAISPTLRERLRELRDRTGVEPAELLEQGSTPPDGLTPRKVEGWLRGSARRAQADHLDHVVAAWEALPARDPDPHVAEQVAAMRGLVEQTGVTPHALLRTHRHDVPEGLNADQVGAWLARTPLQARPDHLAFVLGRWREIAEAGTYYVPITPEIAADLSAERERTGVGPAALYREAETTPEGLGPQTVSQWMNGAQKTARRDHLDWALACWRSLPDLTQPDPAALGLSGYEMHKGRIVLTDEIRDRLRALQQRSGKGPEALLSWAKRCGLDVPKGLAASQPAQWMSGAIGAMKPDHLVFIIEAWERACTGEPSPRGGLRDEDLELLCRHREDGFLPGAAFEGAQDVPEGLTVYVVANWLTGQARTVRSDHLEWVKARCAALAESPTRRIKITEETRATLDAERRRTGVGPAELLRNADGAPEGLSAGMISTWSNRNVRTARKDHVDYVVARWSALPDAGGD